MGEYVSEIESELQRIEFLLSPSFETVFCHSSSTFSSSYRLKEHSHSDWVKECRSRGRISIDKDPLYSDTSPSIRFLWRNGDTIKKIEELRHLRISSFGIGKKCARRRKDGRTEMSWSGCDEEKLVIMFDKMYFKCEIAFSSSFSSSRIFPFDGLKRGRNLEGSVLVVEHLRLISEDLFVEWIFRIKKIVDEY